MRIYSLESKPFGFSFGEWCTRWWQWLLMIPKPINPTNDLTGQNASIGQIDSNVFFLCQTIENARQFPIRKVAIPKGRSIFMPILNWISDSYNHGKTEQELTRVAKTKIDAIQNIVVRLDGMNIQGLEKYRVLSELFTVELPENNILNLPPGQACFISDGYWLFAGPILKDIAISTLGSCSFGVTKIGVSYFLSPLQ